MAEDDFDLDALKAAAARATPRPDPEVRAEHLRLAQEEFDIRQESGADSRHTITGPQRGLWIGVRNMINRLTGKGAMAMTTALVACGFLVLTPTGRDIWQPGPRMSDPAPGTATNAPEPAASLAGAPEPEAATMADTAEAAPPPPAVVADSGLARTMPEMAAPLPLDFSSAPGQALAGSGAVVGGAFAPDTFHLPREPSRDVFANADENPLQVTAENPVSTFSIDVDTASWSIVRQSLNRGMLPPPDAVRVEEMINYFPYSYPAPEGDAAFRPSVTVMPTPWNADTQLVEIGIQGHLPAIADRPPLNLVFLIDTSGSMYSPDKLPLLRAAFRLMLPELRPEDQIAIVTYAGSAGIALEPTPASDHAAISRALDGLEASGSTAGHAGLQQAYDLARQMSDEGETSRVILATDGDFNVGMSGVEEMEDYISDQRDSGISLSVLGFGRGNLNDRLMQTLAQNGNGTASYIDTMSEAQKVLVDQLTGTLFTIASDVKIQVEWNPATVAEYRLIGYETRALNREDFNNDHVDAGDLGAGHTVTAIYEITPVGSPAVLVDPLRYGSDSVVETASDELGFLRLRWKAPGEGDSALLETPILPDAADIRQEDARFAAAIAGFGQLLRGSDWVGDWSWDDAIALAADARGQDEYGYRNEAVSLMRIAAALAAGQ